MLETFENKEEILSTLKGFASKDASSEQLFDLVFDLFLASSGSGTPQQTEMCEDVLTQLIAYVELEARRRISAKIAALENAPRRIVQCLAIENIYVAQPVLSYSPVLEDDDLLMVSRLCGPQHLEAIADRKEISVVVTNELMRLGNVHVWERLAKNAGAKLADKSVAFLANRARQNPKIQYGLISRPDLPETVVTRIIAEAGEGVREHLARVGRSDLLDKFDEAQSAAKKRVLSTTSLLGVEFEAAYQEVLQVEKSEKITSRHLLEAATKDNFPRTCSIFARLSKLELEEAVHWLSRREVDPAIVAFKALSFEPDVVAALLRTGPWKRILTTQSRMRAMRALDELKPDVAKRVFAARNSAFLTQKGSG